jgi:DNA modification methylase
MEINKIYCEDNSETLSRMEDNSIDIILTSPPYNSTDSKHRQSSIKDLYCKRYDSYNDFKDIGEYIDWSVQMFKEFDRVLKDNRIVLYNFSYGTENPHLPYILMNSLIENTNWTIADTIIWKKKSALPNNVSPNRLTRICEFVWVIVRKDEIKTFEMNKEVKSRSRTGQAYYHNYFNFIDAKNNDGSNNLNKAVYSTDLCNRLLSLYAKEGWTVYDPFMGIGTTAKSCISLNMNYIGSEISQDQIDYFTKSLTS